MWSKIGNGAKLGRGTDGMSVPTTVQSKWPYQTYPDRPELEFGSVRAQGSLGRDLVTVGEASGRETACDRLAKR